MAIQTTTNIPPQAGDTYQQNYTVPVREHKTGKTLAGIAIVAVIALIAYAMMSQSSVEQPAQTRDAATTNAEVRDTPRLGAVTSAAPTVVTPIEPETIVDPTLETQTRPVDTNAPNMAP